MGARTASFMHNIPVTSRGEPTHGLPVTSSGGLAPSVPTQGLTPSHASSLGSMNTSRPPGGGGQHNKTPRGNDVRYGTHPLTTHIHTHTPSIEHIRHLRLPLKMYML